VEPLSCFVLKAIVYLVHCTTCATDSFKGIHENTFHMQTDVPFTAQSVRKSFVKKVKGRVVTGVQRCLCKRCTCF